MGEEHDDGRTRRLLGLAAVRGIGAGGRIRYQDWFKTECVERYRQGDSPAAIFREHGLESDLIGYKRIERAIARWRRPGDLELHQAARELRRQAARTPGSEKPTHRRDATPRPGVMDMIAAVNQRVNALEERLERAEEEIRELSAIIEYRDVASTGGHDDEPAATAPYHGGEEPTEKHATGEENDQ